MAGICCGVAGESDGSSEDSSREARRRRMELHRVRIDPGVKQRRLELWDYDKALDNCSTDSEGHMALSPEDARHLRLVLLTPILSQILSNSSSPEDGGDVLPKFGITSVYGWRRDMEDVVAIHPSFCRRQHETAAGIHYFGVYDGHGCSHVAAKCKERLHEMVKEELLVKEEEEGRNSKDWRKCVMERSFTRMDKEVVAWNENTIAKITFNCHYELRTPECDVVGSTTIVAVITSQKIVIANCGDSRAVLCWNGEAVPLSTDHKVSSF